MKVAYSLWFLAWLPVYWTQHGPANLLWLCDVANIVVLLALLLESPLLFSSQATGVLLIQAAWMIDFFGRLALGFHPIGGTEYMFDSSQALWVRAMSLFHLFVPILLIWAILRLGYDRRGWRLESILCWLILPASFVAAPPSDNLNWLWSPFGIEQTVMSAPSYLLFCMFAYPVVIFWPTHRLLLRWARRRNLDEIPTQGRIHHQLSSLNTRIQQHLLGKYRAREDDAYEECDGDGRRHSVTRFWISGTFQLQPPSKAFR